jgi:serine O-acetyltransferase
MKNFLRALFCLFLPIDFVRAFHIHLRIMFWLERKGLSTMANIVHNIVYYRFAGSIVYPTAKIPKSVCFVHPTSIVIATQAVLGERCVVYQNVTIGRGGKRNDLPPPVIGDDTVIFTNAIICGNIKICDNVVVSAGAVVTRDITEAGVYAGSPARLVKPFGETSTEGVYK